MKLKFESAKEDEQPQPKPGMAEEKGVIDRVDQVLAEALQAQATDIHVEPGPEETRVRVRVQGQLQQVATFPSALHVKLVNRFKILGGMDITRSKIPQRGFFKIKAEGVKAECETFVIPSVIGEKVTVDLLLKRGLELSLEHLGFFTEILKSFKDALNKPHGLVLVVGPPASGRTTTCFASLAALNSPQKAVVTFESVNKYELPGVVHCKPSPQHDFGFAEGVRAMMDSNPDACLVGEVQEPEVARLMLQGAFAKRIVLGRMAAHDAVNALVTLMDMGIQPFLLTAAVNAVLSQRLVRRICDGCKEAYEPPEQLINEIGYKMKPGMKLYRGSGCASCAGSGHRGNIAIFELLTPNEDVNEALVARRSQQEIREVATKQGMVPLKRDGVNKAVMGYTTIEEVLNAL